jgi:hypothetical protein
MPAAELRTTALELIAREVNCEIARRLGDWRRPRYVRKAAAGSRCPRCGERSRALVLEPDDYAALLGLYLGDGYIGALARAQRLRLFLDANYATIVDEAEALLASGSTGGRTSRGS